jgi:hypothetical protein
MISVFRSLRGSWLALAIALAAVLLAQVWAGIALRGLYADGAFYAEQLLLRHSFTIIAPSRWTSEVLIQAPAVLSVMLGQDSPYAVALAFSLASNLMPLALTLACLAVLPAPDRAFGLLPVFIFLAASMSAAVASVADGPTAAAYAWLILLLILFGPLTRWRLGMTLLLTLGAVRLDEAMAFLGPILVAACLWRLRTTADRLPRTVLALTGLLIAGGTALAIHNVLHPEIAANRASSLSDLANLRWLISNGGVNLSALAGLVGVAALPVLVLPPYPRTLGMTAALVIYTAIAALALAEPSCPSAAFAARENACLLTAPAMTLLLVLRASGRRLPASTPALLAMLGIAIAAADAAATDGWLTYVRAMRTALATERGVVTWRDTMAKLPPPQAAAMRRYAWPWTTPLMSFWLTPGPIVATLIANPDGVPWQPFDPETVRWALAATAPAITQTRFATLLGQHPLRWNHPVGLFAFSIPAGR